MTKRQAFYSFHKKWLMESWTSKDEAYGVFLKFSAIGSLDPTKLPISDILGKFHEQLSPGECIGNVL